MPDEIVNSPAYRELMAEFAGYQRGVEHGRATNVGTTVQAARMWAYEQMQIDPDAEDVDLARANCLADWVMTGISDEHSEDDMLSGAGASE